jgi:hypothetical protein
MAANRQTEKYLSITGIIVLTLFSCASKKNNQNGGLTPVTSNSSTRKDSADADNSEGFRYTGDSIEIPAFEIEINLSNKADQKLKAGKETIIVKAFFSGIPKDTTLKEYKDDGEIGIVFPEIELSNTRIAKFQGIKFSRKTYDALADKDITLLINVYSGRKSTSDNLLNCDILSEKISKVKGKRLTLHGKLIYGDD